MEYYQGKYSEFLKKIREGDITVKPGEEIFFTIKTPPEKAKADKKLSKDKEKEEDKAKELIDKLKEIAESMVEEQPIPEPGSGEPDLNHDATPPKSVPWFTARLKSIFKDNAIRRTNGNKRFGELDFKKLHRIATTEKVFMRPERIDLKKYAVSLVVDCSGSMMTQKARVASSATMALIKEFQNLVPLEVMTFNMREVVVKKFEEKLDDAEIAKVGNIIIGESQSSWGNGNHDHIAVEKAAKSLSLRKGRRVMIVLSDGQPSCGCSVCDASQSSLASNLIKTVKEVRGQGIIPLSVGIMTRSVEAFYPDYEVINKVDELYDAILRLLSKTIRRLPVK